MYLSLDDRARECVSHVSYSYYLTSSLLFKYIYNKELKVWRDLDEDDDDDDRKTQKREKREKKERKKRNFSKFFLLTF